MEGLVVPGHEDDSAMMQGVDPSGFEESPSSGLSNPVERSEKDGNASSDHDMELSLEVQRELDLISERQNKRAREEGGEDRECRAPPYPRVARAERAAKDARGARAVPTLEEDDLG
jgi:hypothetical protein